MKKFDELMSVGSEIENISAEDAKKKLNDPNVQFIDVRDKDSFSKGTIGNAVHMDRGLLEFYLAEGSPLENDIFKNNPDKEFVVFLWFRWTRNSCHKNNERHGCQKC
jgi:rhodanese-related sulfurtransferase